MILIATLPIALSLRNVTTFEYAIIGDSLLNTSGIIKLNSSTEKFVAFDTRVEAVYHTSTKPPIITNYLPKREMIASESYSDYNYLGIDEPIYLLPGSKIIYSIKVTMAKATSSSTNIACIIHFHNLIRFTGFIRYGVYSEPNKHCFIAADMSTAVLSWSFNITEESQYYVGITVKEGVTVTSTVSIIRTYYDISQLTPENMCIDSLSCDITTCSSGNCDESYIIIETKNSTYVLYAAEHSRLVPTYITVISVTLSALIMLVISIIMVYAVKSKFTKQKRKLRSSKNSACDTVALSKRQQSSVSLIPNPKLLSQLYQNKPVVRKITPLFDYLEADQSEDYPQYATISDECVHIPRQLKNDDLSVALNRQQLLRSFAYNTAQSNIETGKSSTQEPRPVAMETIMHATTMTHSIDETSFVSNDQVVPDTNQTTFNYPEACTSSRAEVIKSTFVVPRQKLPFQPYTKSMYLAIILFYGICNIGVFGELQELSLDSSGLVYHNSEYEVTLVIPEGAIQQSATVWFGACLYSDKFKFGDYVPVTPIVWVHIDQKLMKPAELYLPHHINTETTKTNLFPLTANDETFIKEKKFLFTISDKVEIEIIDPELFKTCCYHFCSHCIAVRKIDYDKIQKQYKIVRAEKQEGATLNADFCIFYRYCRQV